MITNNIDQLIANLLEIQSYAEIRYCLFENFELFTIELLRAIDSKIKLQEDVIHKTKLELVKDYANKAFEEKNFVVFINMPTGTNEIGFLYNYMHYIATDENHDMMQAYLSQFANELETLQFLKEKENKLYNGIVAFYLDGSWEQRQQLLRRGLKWFGNNSAFESFEKRMKESPNSKDFINYFLSIVKRCLEVGADQALFEYNLIDLYQSIQKAQGLEKIQFYRKALDLCEFHDSYKWALLQIEFAYFLFDNAVKDNLTDRSEEIGAFNAGLSVLKKESNPKLWAEIKNHLGIAYRNHSIGNRAEHMDDAISAYQESATYFSEESEPGRWAALQNNLGNAYCERINGNLADNIESAIAAYENALKVYKIDSFPEDCAMTTVNLGTAYSSRIYGETLENMERAKELFESALPLRSKINHPQEWAMCHYNLGNIYSTRIAGLRYENLEKSIFHYKESLETRRRTIFPIEWALTQSNLSGVMIERILGDKVQNIEDAISYAKAALEVFVGNGLMIQRSMALTQLGRAMSKRMIGDTILNNLEAVKALEEAKQLYVKESSPQEWALCRVTLATLIYDLHGDDNRDDIDNAIHLLLEALTVFTEESIPQRWANAQFNLSTVYRHSGLAGRPADFVLAEQAALKALKIYTRGGNPFEWAHCQSNLGLAIYEIDKVNNLTAAQEALKEALNVFPFELFPEDNIRTLDNIGGLYYDSKDYINAVSHFEQVHKLIQRMRAQTQHAIGRKWMSTQYIGMYAKLTNSFLQLGNIQSAARYAIICKSRTIAEQMAGAGEAQQYLKNSSEVLRKEYESIEAKQNDLTKYIANRFRRSENTASIVVTEDMLNAEELKEIRSRREEINRLTDELFLRHPILTGTQSLPDIELVQVFDILQQNQAGVFIDYSLHAGGVGVFIFKEDEVDYIHLFDNFPAPLVYATYNIRTNAFWNGEDWKDHLRMFYQTCFQPISKYLPPNGKLIISPTHVLHLLPFQAMLDENGTYLCDRYDIDFTPTIAVLTMQTAKKKIRSQESLLCVAHPGDGSNRLHFVMEEVEMISQQFLRMTILNESVPIKDVVSSINSSDSQVIHFSCHASFDPGSPPHSGLYLKGGLLSINDIRLKMRLNNCPLVVLSACVTGQINPSLADESVGISLVFLGIGASVVISSLWSVNDFSTSLLFGYFYEIRRQSRKSDAACLRMAMQKLRKTVKFSHPYYWAAFQTSSTLIN